MDATGFNTAYWSHWLLIGCFVSVSAWGLLLSWQWRQEARMKDRQAKLARRLAVELHGVDYSSKVGFSPLERSIVSDDE